MIHLAMWPEKGANAKEAAHIAGKPRHPSEKPIRFGIGFCSHMPDKMDSVVLSNVVLENVAGKVH